MSKKCFLILLVTLSCLSQAVAKEPTLEDKIGQMFILGFYGSSLNSEAPIIQDIKERNLGGVILFHIEKHSNIKSPEQLKALTQTLKEAAKTPLIIAIDQEGGVVNHLKTDYGFPEAKLTAKDLGKYGDTKYTYQYASGIAQTLKEQGITVNFAPVVDLQEEGNFIDAKGRAFSPIPDVVSAHARAFIQAHKEKKILTALKHFPGHGSSVGDTHEGFVDVTQTWSETELAPYTQLIGDNQADMIMVAHVINKKIDEEYPASLSSKTINDLLRKKMGYDGIVVTDDISMGAITENYSFNDAVVRAVIAGNDWIIIGHGQLDNPNILQEAIQYIKDAVEAGRITEAQINASYERILRLKATIAS